MSDAEPGVVWILGAGFSKGLGGPLIADLLAFREEAVLRNFFPSKTFPGVAARLFKARLFYGFGRRQGYWENAEQFLDLVESAASEEGDSASHANLLLSSMLKNTVRYPETVQHAGGAARMNLVTMDPGPTHDFESLAELADACRAALAVDCSLFLRAAQPDSERWSPYREWVRTLQRNHTIITFNYDHVPEILASKNKNIRVIDPGDVEDDLNDCYQLQTVPVLKVHGSVTWRRKGKSIVVVPIDDPALGDPREDVVIGVPGPGKRMLSRETLKHLWKAALTAIRGAGEVILLGYRFPPTDADARRDLLGALRANPFNGKGLSVRTVLGPSVDAADSIRVQHLLRATVSGNIEAIPLLAEDYLGLVGGILR